MLYTSVSVAQDWEMVDGCMMLLDSDSDFVSRICTGFEMNSLTHSLTVSAPGQRPATAAAAITTPRTTEAPPPVPSSLATALPGQFVSHSMGQHPVVITVPHGGYRRPSDVADRRKTPG